MTPSTGRDPIPRRPIGVVFGLFSALLALLTMRILGTPDLDRIAYVAGIVLAAVVGTAVATIHLSLLTSARVRGLSWVLVPLGGSVVGVAVQSMIYASSPVERPIMLAVGLSTFEPERWILCGIPMGAIPALVATAVLGLAARMGDRHGSADARERMTAPFAGACALLAVPAIALARGAELTVVVVMLALSLGALAQVLSADHARMQWLHRIFVGEERAFEVVPLESCASTTSIPAAVGAVVPRAAIVKVVDDATYRGAARTPYASTGKSEREAVAPLRHRRLLVWTVLGMVLLGAPIAIVARLAMSA